MKRQSGSRPAVFSYPNNFARFPEEGARPHATNRRRAAGCPASVAQPSTATARARPTPSPLLCLPVPLVLGSLCVRRPSSSALSTPAPQPLSGARNRGGKRQGTDRTGHADGERREERGPGRSGGWRPGGLEVPGTDRANARSAPRIPQGLTPQRRGQHPPPTPPHESSHLCAQLTAAELSFRRAQQLFSPSSRRALHLPAGGRPAPRPWHRKERPPGLAVPGAHGCPPVAPAAAEEDGP